MEYNLIQFDKELRAIGIELNDMQHQQFIKYYELLIEWNKVMNLTGITEWQEVLEKHFLDSLSLVKFYAFHPKQQVLDLGTGAGFPGIPLKIVFPELDIVLMDSLNKRIVFLQEVIKQLGLRKIEAVHGRAEEMARQGKYREKFDVCVSRAVANLASLGEYCIPFVKMNGYFISYKSGEVEEEVKKAKKAIMLLGGKLERVEKFSLGEEHMGRSFIIIKKEKKTPKTYPRKAGTTTKSPLGQA